MQSDLIREAISAIRSVSETSTNAILKVLDHVMSGVDADPMASTKHTPVELSPEAKPDPEKEPKKKKKKTQKKKQEPKDDIAEALPDPFDDPDFDPDFDQVPSERDELEADRDSFDQGDLDADLDLGQPSEDTPPVGLPKALHSAWKAADPEGRQKLEASLAKGNTEAEVQVIPKKGRRSPGDEPTIRQASAIAAKKAGMSKKDCFFLCVMGEGATVEEMIEVWELLSGEKSQKNTWSNYVKWAQTGKFFKRSGGEVLALDENEDSVFCASENQDDEEFIMEQYSKLQEAGTAERVAEALTQVMEDEG